MKKVFICSHYRGDVKENTRRAARYCRFALQNGVAPMVPHLLYPKAVDDSIVLERDAGINAGIEYLKLCDELWVFYPYDKKGPSPGMVEELRVAESLEIPIVLYRVHPLFETSIINKLWGKIFHNQPCILTKGNITRQ